MVLISRKTISSLLLCNVWIRYFKKFYVGARHILCAGTVVKWNRQTTCLVISLVIVAVGFGLLVWSVLCSTTSTPTTGTTTGTPTTSYDDLRKTIADSFECRDNPGMVVNIVKDGKTVFSEAYGVVLPGSKVKVTTDTKFLISSLSKAFTAALLVNVFGNNTRNVSYDLATPLRDILGDGFRFEDDQRTKYGSAEDLLSHRIGLPNKGFMRFNPNINRSDFLIFPRYWKTQLPFRGTAKYSSVTYTLAAAITEKLGGKRWEELAKERLFEPLGLTETGFAYSTDFSADDVVKPYSLYKGRKAVIDPLFTRVWNSRCGSGCIVSTSSDMVKWMNIFLTGGRNARGDQVWPEDEVRALTKVRTYLRSSRRDIITKPEFPATSVADDYAFGWRNGFYNGYKLLSHTGSSPGFASMLMLYPGENMGIYVAMNGDDDKFYYRLALVHYISDFMFGRTSWLNTTTMCSFPEPWASPVVRPIPHHFEGLQPTLPYNNYIGTYRSTIYGDLTVSFNQSTSHLRGSYGVGSWKLFAQKENNTFFGKGILATDFWDMPNWRFLTPHDNPQNVTGLIVTGFDVFDPPEFDKVFDGKKKKKKKKKK